MSTKTGRGNPLPPLKRAPSIKAKRVSVPLPGVIVKPKRVGGHSLDVKRFRPAAVVKASTEEFKQHLADLGQERSETDKKIAELMPEIRRMEEIQKSINKKSTHLSVEEQTVILEAHFSKGIGPIAIAKILDRPHSTISRFIQRYTSTAPIARATMKAGAETLAKRIIKNANVSESLEVLDRLDALPKQDRGKSSDTGPRFNIIVAMPGSSTNAPPVPDQALIEASVVKP